jgi:ubiquinone/menaquinone biosynthesis C-methylase UbiE
MSQLAPSTDELQTLKDGHRRMWASGDYARAAEPVTGVGEQVVASAGVRPGADVLDVAAGTGNAAIPAALAGANVTAIDLTPELFVAGRRRAKEAGVEIEWIAADAEALPFEDESFDTVLSSLGVQFVPRHAVVAAELVRVCRPGGTIALGNWAADGFIGRFWTTMGPYMPPPPAYASPPAGWGRPEHVDQLFAEHPVELELERHAVDFEAESAEAYVEFLSDFYGPLVQARAKLSEAGRWDELHRELVVVGNELNADEDGGFRVASEYIVTLARKRRA